LGPNLFRVDKGANEGVFTKAMRTCKVKVPANAWLFAGSVMHLQPGAEYDLKLTLSDADGGKAEKTLKVATTVEPLAPTSMTEQHVVPGAGGGSGSASHPFKGLDAAQAVAKPGDLFLVHAGTYEGEFIIGKSGSPCQPIIWRGAGDGEIIFKGKPDEGNGSRAITALAVHDVWFENITVCNATWGMVAHNSERIVVRRCHFKQVQSGITARQNTNGNMSGFFVSDNLVEGKFKWGADIPHIEARGIELSGEGHQICYNRVLGFKDAIDTAPSPVCCATDIHHNDVSELYDDGIELDGSERNVRCYENRIANVLQGISVQPVYGGPVYAFRNVLYNVQKEPFKMNNCPSGALFLHNTIVKYGPPAWVATPATIYNWVTRNNLYIGTAGTALLYDAQTAGCTSIMMPQATLAERFV
jgi:hypothetical protein